MADQLPTTLADLDARIARDHAGIEAAYQHGQDGVAEFLAYDIARCETIRPVIATGSPTVDMLLRMRLRGVAARYAAAAWAGDRETADRLRAELDRLERGQL